MIAEPRILALDTSLGSLAAVAVNGRVFERHSDNALGHAEVIGELVAGALADAGITASELTHVVMGVGPGPFTGLRIGMAAAHGFAAGAGLPLLPVVSHEAVAREALGADPHPKNNRVRVIQDARRKELFVSEWQRNGARIEAVGQPRVVAREGIAADAADVWHTRVPGRGLCEAARERLVSGAPFVSPQPLYLRDPDVRPPAGKRAAR